LAIDCGAAVSDAVLPLITRVTLEDFTVLSLLETATAFAGGVAVVAIWAGTFVVVSLAPAGRELFTTRGRVTLAGRETIPSAGCEITTVASTGCETEIIASVGDGAATNAPTGFSSDGTTTVDDDITAMMGSDDISVMGVLPIMDWRRDFGVAARMAAPPNELRRERLVVVFSSALGNAFFCGVRSR
jgi:hypothetical protein